MRHGDVIFTLRRHGLTCGLRAPDVLLFTFYLSPRLVRVCEIENYLTCVKTMEIPIWCVRMVNSLPVSDNLSPLLLIFATSFEQIGPVWIQTV